MKVSSNIGIISALLRITFGLTFLAWSTAKLSRRPWCSKYVLIMILSAMKVGEGIVRYCPITELFQKQSFNMSPLKNSADHKESKQSKSDQFNFENLDLTDLTQQLNEVSNGENHSNQANHSNEQ
ncbi:YgaP family membrane protein [Heyndrickxia ginsengihumi]|uniref:DUF2892 domain-containing protein n=1 Tax=Heyndrickxia ginsengihumi TaxID=363870 RepID=A0A6M0P9V2_9BACI|nr:DUF2892 domain-containing protein [Bacillus sp. (in: firmicutes)]NEY21291.1 DUF2892 domain-containing protein [Heyndrickxia ginsengihumi]